MYLLTQRFLHHHNIPISTIPGNHTHINSEIIT